MIQLKTIVKSKRRSKAGLSMVELLFSMAIFGVIIGALGSMLASNSKLTGIHTNQATANVALRQSLLRISDMISQAHYIYPANQVINLQLNSGANKTITTGAAAVAFLLPSGSTYCPGTAKTYCGYIISIENRDQYANILQNSAHASDFVLASWRSQGIDWPRKTIPAQSIVSWDNVSGELLADSINKNESNLAAVDRLETAQANANYDKANNFSIKDTEKDQSNALIASVSPSLTISFESNNSIKNSNRIAYVFARAIPRGTQPNPE